MGKLIIILLILFAGSANADSLLIHGASYHLERERVAGWEPYKVKYKDEYGKPLIKTKYKPIKENYNEANFGLGYEWKNITVGAYYNSIENLSIYAAYTFKIDSFPYIQLKAGAISGYKDGIIPLLLPVIHIPIVQNIFTETTFIPAIANKTPAVFGFSMGVKF